MLKCAPPLCLYEDSGPFDIVGDVHGCLLELLGLLKQLGAFVDELGRLCPAPGRRLVFLGDFVDRGPYVVETLALVSDLWQRGLAYAVIGNHDDRLRRGLQGNSVGTCGGYEQSWRQLYEAGVIDKPYSPPGDITPDDVAELPFVLQSSPLAKVQELFPGLSWPQFNCQQLIEFLSALPSHIIFDNGHLVVVHAGLLESWQGRDHKSVRRFCLYACTGRGVEYDQDGYPKRSNWAEDYCGQASVVYGHTPRLQASWLNNTIDIDTGCVFGGCLTALSWPERRLISEPALRTYCPHPLY